MNTRTRVLVGVDDSANAARAVTLALELARTGGSELVLCHVRRPVLVSQASQPKLSAELEAVTTVQAERLLTRLEAEAKALGVPSLQVVTSGNPALQLAEIAEDARVRWVVVGSRGRGALSAALLGSTSRQLVGACSKPVLVVP